jgi:O-antigen/teichoic acid export membrane protein
MTTVGILAQPVAPPALKVGGKILARNTVLNIVGQVVPLLIGVATTPYVIRHLGPDRFGLLSLAWIVVGYFGLFDLGIGPATTKFVAELLGKGESEKLPALVWTALTTQSGMGLVAGLLLATASPALVNHLLKVPPALRADARWVFLILAVSFPINFAGGSLRGVLAAFQRFDLANVIGVPTTALWYLIPAGALALGLDLPAIVLLLVISRVMALGAHFFFCQRLCPALRSGYTFKRSLVRSLLGYGGWIALSATMAPILAYFERFLIGALLSIAAVGFYTPPYMIASRLGILPGSLTARLFPAFSASAGRGDGEWIRNALVRCLKYLLLIVGPAALVLIFFAHPLLTLWVGAKFADEGALVLQILAGGVLINSLAYVPSSLLQGIGRPDVIAKLQLLQLPFHIGLSWFLVSRLGLPGAAIAWSVRMTLDFVMYIVATCWVTHTSPRLLAGRKMLAGVAALGALTLGFASIRVSSHALLTGALFSGLLAAGFLLGAWHYVLDVEERWHIRLWVRTAKTS